MRKKQQTSSGNNAAVKNNEALFQRYAFLIFEAKSLEMLAEDNAHAVINQLYLVAKKNLNVVRTILLKHTQHSASSKNRDLKKARRLFHENTWRLISCFELFIGYGKLGFECGDNNPKIAVSGLTMMVNRYVEFLRFIIPLLDARFDCTPFAQKISHIVTMVNQAIIGAEVVDAKVICWHKVLTGIFAPSISLNDSSRIEQALRKVLFDHVVSLSASPRFDPDELIVLLAGLLDVWCQEGRNDGQMTTRLQNIYTEHAVKLFRYLSKNFESGAYGQSVLLDCLKILSLEGTIRQCFLQAISTMGKKRTFKKLMDYREIVERRLQVAELFPDLCFSWDCLTILVVAHKMSQLQTLSAYQESLKLLREYIKKNDTLSQAVKSEHVALLKETSQHLMQQHNQFLTHLPSFEGIAMLRDVLGFMQNSVKLDGCDCKIIDALLLKLNAGMVKGLVEPKYTESKSKHKSKSVRNSKKKFRVLDVVRETIKTPEPDVMRKVRRVRGDVKKHFAEFNIEKHRFFPSDPIDALLRGPCSVSIINHVVPPIVTYQRKLSLPHCVDLVINILEKMGGRALLFSGAIRDILLGNTVVDYDIATTLNFVQLAHVFGRFKPKIRKNLDMVVLHIGNIKMDIRSYPVKAHSYVALMDALISGCLFTAEALYYHPTSSQLCIYQPATKHLQMRRMIATRELESIFDHDPSVIMRVIYLKVAKGLHYPMHFRRLKDKLVHCQNDRLSTKVVLLLTGKHALAIFNELCQLKLFTKIFPCLATVDRVALEASLSPVFASIHQAERPDVLLFSSCLWLVARGYPKDCLRERTERLIEKQHETTYISEHVKWQVLDGLVYRDSRQLTGP